jgi:serine/threonine protein kinase
MAPEVFSRQYGRPSSKSDIYSFGMVILEMVGARKKENLPASGGQTFPTYLIDQLDEFCSNVTNVTGERNSDTELVKKMVIVALHCVQIHPAQRPSPSKVLEMLESQYFKLELPPKVEFSVS